MLVGEGWEGEGGRRNVDRSAINTNCTDEFRISQQTAIISH